MKEFFAAMLQDSAVGKIGRCFGKEKSQSLVYGLAGSQKHGLVCFIQAADVASYASKHRMSDEMAAREVRYAFLRETAAAIGGAKIATAHHRDDQAETVLLHLLRGSGSCGLGGIRSAADGIIRPFLGVTRAEIETYCRERKLAPRHDRSGCTGKSLDFSQDQRISGYGKRAARARYGRAIGIDSSPSRYAACV